MNRETPFILLVEDDPNDEELTRMALQENHILCDLVVVNDGELALDYLFRRGMYADLDPNILPKIVLLDLNLPKVDGIEVLRQIRADERTRIVPVVIFSSSKEEKDVETCFRLGANAFVRKPIDFTEFSEALHQLGLFWILWNLTPKRKAG